MNNSYHRNSNDLTKNEIQSFDLKAPYDYEESGPHEKIFTFIDQDVV